MNNKIENKKLRKKKQKETGKGKKVKVEKRGRYEENDPWHFIFSIFIILKSIKL